MGEVLEALSPHLDARRHLIVSIAAGITLDTYEGALPAGTRVIRVMPNTPLLVGQGAACYCLGSSATPEDEAQLRALLAASGLVLSVPGMLPVGVWVLLVTRCVESYRTGVLCAC